MSDRPLPKALRGVRVCLFITAGITFLVGIGGLMADGFSGETLGAFTYLIFPGVLALIFGLRLPKGTRALFWAIIALGAFQLLQALGNLGAGDPRALTQSILPILTIVLVTRSTSRAHLLH